MKHFTTLFLLTFLAIATQAQDYQISFAGIGAATSVDSVQVENMTQCTRTNINGHDILHLTSKSGINEGNIYAGKEIHVYPNPNTGAFSIDFEATDQGNTTINLYDISGKNIIHEQQFLPHGQYTYNLSGICSGIYTLKILSDKYSYTAKIVSINETHEVAEIKHFGQIPIIDNQNIVNIAKMKSLESAGSLIDVQYNTGDILKLTGKTGVFRTVSMLVPTQSQTVTFNFVACTDADNNNYAVLQIGAQTWMAENLKTSKFDDGTQIPSIADSIAWEKLKTPGYCWYNNDSVKNKNTYGALYNWFAVKTGKLCPKGWHVPTHDEWTTFERAICTSGTCNTDFPFDSTTTGFRGTDEGAKIKVPCLTYWLTPNTGATNSIGFSGLPGGVRNLNFQGEYRYIGVSCEWWSSTEFDATKAWYRDLYYDYKQVTRGHYNKDFGFSVRCVKD